MRCFDNQFCEIDGLMRTCRSCLCIFLATIVLAAGCSTEKEKPVPAKPKPEKLIIEKPLPPPADVLPVRDFGSEFVKLTKAAAAARSESNFEIVEQKRWERWKLLKSWDKEEQVQSPIIKGFRAIVKVDGQGGDDPGLINRLNYEESFEILREAWDAMCQAAPEGPVLGEVATRMFEVIQQRNSFLDSSKTDELLPNEKMLAILQRAEKLDPCCVAAVPMVEWFKPLDESESFTRAEVRPSFKARQAHLLDISHPLNKITKVGADRPVLPWHAATEYLKAQSLQNLLDEYDQLEHILPNWYRIADKEIEYMIPRSPIKGLDARGDKFELLYGRLYVTTVQDKNLRRRGAAYLSDENGNWRQRFLDILWKEPSKSELRSKLDRTIVEPEPKEPSSPEWKELQAKKLEYQEYIHCNEFMSNLEVLEKWELDGTTFKLLRYPINDTEGLLKLKLPILCLKDSFRLKTLQFTDNNSDKLLKERSKISDDFQSSPRILKKLTPYRIDPPNGNPPTGNPPIGNPPIGNPPIGNPPIGNPLEHMMSDNMNPILVVSDSLEKKTHGPHFEFYDDRPFLKLENGGRLWFVMTGEESPSCYTESRTGKTFFPLHPKGIPEKVIGMTGIGQVLINTLKHAKYSEEDAKVAIADWLKSNFKIKPTKFMKFVESNHLSLKDIVSTERNRQGYRDNDEISIQNQFNLEYAIYGYRHFIDSRGNFIFSSELLNNREQRQHIFAFCELGRGLIEGQHYSFNDLQQIKENITNEHLTKAFDFEPSFGTYLAMVNNSSELIHPSDKRPPYLQSPANPPPANPASANPASDQVTNALSAPIAQWLMNEDPNQHNTVASLHNAYAKIMFDEIKLIKLAQEDKTNPEANFNSPEAKFNSPKAKFNSKNSIILAIHQASARRYAGQKYFHRAILYYNGLLEMLPVDDGQNFNDLMINVPTSERAESFLKSLDTQIDSVKTLVCIQTELAIVLHSAGYSDSAHAVFSRAIDDYESLFKPLCELLKQVIASYGLSLSKTYEPSLKKLDDMVKVSRNSIEKFSLSIAWRDPSFAKESEIAESLVSTRVLANLLDKQTTAKNKVDKGLKISGDESIELENLRSLDARKLVKEFRFWLERKQILIQHPDIGLRINPNSDFDVRIAMPYTYDKKVGFSQQIDPLIRETDVNEFAKWCSLSLDEANKSPNAAANSFLLAWHWLDRGDNAKARAALMNLSLVSIKQVQDGKVDEATFLHKINSYAALASANCISLKLPGISGLKVDFTHALKPQLKFWTREWSASGRSAAHAHSVEIDILRIIQSGQDLMRRSTASTVNKSYFFCDYKCEFGGVPDCVVDDVLNKPDLFQQIVADQVNGEVKPNAVQGGQTWILINEEAATTYFKEFKLDQEISMDIINTQ